MKKILCFGDSLTYGYGVSQAKVWHQLLAKEKELRILNRGQNGDSLLGMSIRLQRDVFDSGADLCFFMAASNDLISGRKLEDVYADIKEIREKISQAGIRCIYFLPPPAIAELAQVSWDSWPDYQVFNKDLEKIGLWAQEDFPEDFLNIYAGFSSLEYLERKKLYLDGIHLTSQGHALLASLVTDGLSWTDLLATGALETE